jgi:CDP-4-dehydro-6-deoxyglucose reductase, E1
MSDRDSPEAQALREEILRRVAEYYRLAHAPRPAFVPGQSYIPYGARVFDERELVGLVDSALEFWLTAGRCAQRLEDELARWLGVAHCLLTSSGSSANLLAIAALAVPELGERRLRRGDEVITVAAGFPTTVTPILQHGAIPVFVDCTVDDGTYNVDVRQLDAALSPRTRAVMLAHTLGNPIDLDAVTSFCARHGLWFIEDNCDALGSRYRGRLTGTFGDLATSSFYPSHHITTGEGGAVYTRSAELRAILASLRDWGRDCRCDPGQDNACGRRFSWQHGELPAGYDHKYVYSHLGYNLKVTDLQGAIGLAQLAKLDGFVAARRRNWQTLADGLADLEDRFILPRATAGSEPSWFGFALTPRPGSGLDRDRIIRELEAARIQTRLLFAGNLVRQPCFDELRRTGEGYRVVGELCGTDRIMASTFWVGVYPGISPEMLEHMLDTLRAIAR